MRRSGFAATAKKPVTSAAVRFLHLKSRIPRREIALTRSKVSLHCRFVLRTAKRRLAPSRLTLSRASQISV